MVLMRHEIGDVLRDYRLQKGKTLRQVAGRANVALGYLSEIERGQKEASSEVLASIAEALDEPLSHHAGGSQYTYLDLFHDTAPPIIVWLPEGHFAARFLTP